jgi:hypothetical protein
MMMHGNGRQNDFGLAVDFTEKLILRGELKC